MHAWAAWALIAVSLLGLAINLYFATLLYALPDWLTRLLGGTARMCGIDGASCKRVVETPYARLFAGAPNIVAGLPWSLLCIALAVVYLFTGVFHLWWLAAFVAAASLVVGAYLVYVLLVVLKDPCPL